MCSLRLRLIGAGWRYLAGAVTRLAERHALVLLAEHSQSRLGGLPLGVSVKLQLGYVVKQFGQVPLDLRSRKKKVSLTYLSIARLL